MADLIQKWRNRSPAQDKANQKFVKQLKKKKGKALDQKADALHDDAFRQIDCLDCANCCTSIPPIVNRTDVNRLAKHLGMKATDFESTYTRIDEDGDRVINQSPCPFLLNDNKCLVYEQRPRACREYPHTDQMGFSKHMKIHAANSRYCPAVFHILEELKKGL